MTPPRQPRPRQAAAATRRRTRRTEREPSVDDVVEIWWDVDKTYYRGRLTRRLEQDMHFTMLYDDGETEDVNLHNEFWKFADDEENFRSPPPSSDSDPEFGELELQQRANASQSHRDTSIGRQQSAGPPTQAPNHANNLKSDAHQRAQFTNSSALRTRKSRPESQGKGRPKLKRTKNQGADKSAIPKHAAKASTAIPSGPQNASAKPHSSPQPPRSHVAAHLLDSAPSNNVSASQHANDVDDNQNMENSNKDCAVNKEPTPMRMKLVKTADAKGSHTNIDHAVVQKASSGTKRKLSSEPFARSSALNAKPSGNVEGPNSCATGPQPDEDQQLVTETETNGFEKSKLFQALPTGTNGNSLNMPSPTRRRSIRRRIHSPEDDNSTDSSSSSPNSRAKKDTQAGVEDPMDIIVNKDSEQRTTVGEARDHSIPLKVSLKRANLRVMAASKDHNLRNAHVSQSKIDIKQENVINEIRAEEPHRDGVVVRHSSGSPHRGNEQNLSVQANQTSNFETEVIDSSKKSVSPLRVANEGLETQSREGDRANNIVKAPNLELISPVSGLPELDTCIYTAFGRRLEPIENHLNKLTSEVQHIKSGFNSARQTFAGMVATKESDINGVKVDLAALNGRLETIHTQIGALREDMKTNRADTQSIKRDMANVVSFLRQQAQLRSLVTREQIGATSGNAVRSSAIPESRNAPPRQNGQLAVATHVQPRAPGGANVHHYATPVAQRAVRNAVEYQQRTAPTVDVAQGARQRANTFPVQRPVPAQNARRVSIQGGQVSPLASSMPSQGNRVQLQRNHIQTQGTQAVTVREQQTGRQAVLYAVNYAENRNRTEVFTYQVMELVARQVTVWLLETSHEHHKSGMSLDTWAKRTSSTTYARIAPRLAMYRTYEHAMSTLAMSLNVGVVDLTWFMSPFENQCTERARRNYDAWDPPPNDGEWLSEMHLLKELAFGFHRTFQNYSHPESTVLEVSVLLTRRAARDYEEAGYRPILSLANDAQRQQEAQVYNAQVTGTPIGGWRHTSGK